MKVTVPRHVYCADQGFYELSHTIPNVSVWQETNTSFCWPHLEDWLATGDAVRTEVDCHSPWPEQAARLSALLEARFAG